MAQRAALVLAEGGFLLIAGAEAVVPAHAHHAIQIVVALIVFVLRSAEFLGESDEKPFRPADIAEPIRVFILDYVAYELRAAFAEPFQRLVDVVHGEHDAEIA
jgi:hypothetical protein